MHTRPNPFFDYLQTTPEKCETTADGRTKFYPLTIPITQPTLHINGTTETVAKHHLSIYQEYIDAWDLFSPLHYTVEFASGLEKRFYFDEGGNLLTTCDFKTKYFIEANVRIRLDNLYKDILKKKKENADAAKKAKLDLDNKSKELTDHAPTKINQEYNTLLAKTIALLKEHAKLEFKPDYSVINMLETGLNNRIALEKSHQAMLQTVTLTSEGSEELDDAVETKGETPPPAIQSAQVIKREKHSQQLDKSKKALNEQLKKTPPNDINNIRAITHKLDALNKMESEAAIQACIDGDLKILKRHFNSILKKDESLIPALLSTCNYHNHPTLFDYIYKHTKCHYVKHQIYKKPYLNSKTPSDELDLLTQLGIAFSQKDILKFKKLLFDYGYKPNPPFIDESLLMSTARNPEDIEFLNALLQAGVDPNASSVNTFIYGVSTAIEEDPEFIKQFESRFMVSRNNNTALHIAVLSENIKALESLLAHPEIKTDVNNSQNLTPYQIAICKFGKDAVFNKEVVRCFINSKHSVDQFVYEGNTTALYLACVFNRMDVAAILIEEFKANPCLKRTKIVKSGDATYKVQDTPLIVALTNGFMPLATLILQKCDISLEDLQYTYLHCKMTDATQAITFMRKICLNRWSLAAEKAFLTTNYDRACMLYSEALKLIKTRDEMHLLFFKYACALEKAGKITDAIQAVTLCIELRTQLARDPIKSEGLKPLIIEAVCKLESLTKTNTAQLKPR